MFLPLFLALATLTITPTPTPTPQATPTSTSEIQNLKDIIHQKVMEKLQQISNPTVSKKAIIGKVIQTSDTSIAIDYQNTTRTLNISADTTYVDAKRNKSSLSALKIGQDILAMGINNADTNTFDAKRIIFIDINSLQPVHTTVIGKIVDISKSSPIFTLIPSHNKNNLFQIKTDPATAVFDKNQKIIFIPDLKSGDKIIALLTADKKVTKTYYAEKIYDFDYNTKPLSPTPTKKP